MTRDVKDKQQIKDDLREKLIIEAIRMLDEGGIAAIKARDLAQKVGCSVGTIYNLVGDLDGLILLASARTLEEFKLFAITRYETANAAGASDRELLKTLARAYIEFSNTHPKRWQANFELKFDEESDYYKTYVSGQQALIGLIVSVLERRVKTKDSRELLSIARALWGSVHGISMLAMSNPSNVLPTDKVLDQCMRIVDPVMESIMRQEALAA